MTKKREPADPGRSLLGGYLAGFSRWMEEHGYAASTVEQYRVIGRRFDGYLTDHEIDVRGLDEGHVDGYRKQVKPLRPNGQQAVVAEYYCRACRLLIKYRREQGAAAPAAHPAPGPAILCDYLSFLSDHRALALTSIAQHERWLLQFFGRPGAGACPPAPPQARIPTGRALDDECEEVVPTVRGGRRKIGSFEGVVNDELTSRWSIGLTQPNHWSHNPAGTTNGGFNALEPTGHWDRIDGTVRSMGSMMKRHDDSQRSDRLAVTFGDPHESLTARRVYASVLRVGFDGSVMKRHDDSQRSGRWPVMLGDVGDVRVVDRVAASVASLPRLGLDGSMMTRHDDSQRSRPLAVTATSPPPVAATLAGGRKGRSPRLTWSGEPVTIGSSGIERMPMKRHDDSQRRDPLAVRVGHLRVVDRVVASIASLPRLGFDGPMMKRHDDSQRSDRLAVRQPMHPPPPPHFSNRRTTNRSG